MRRIAIINHKTHELYVEDINDKILEGQYGGDEQLYIEENYNLDDFENYSWDWIIDAEYFREFEKTPIEINFKDIGDL